MLRRTTNDHDMVVYGSKAMNVTTYKKPFTFIVIDDWLDTSLNLKIQESICQLIPYMKESKVGSDSGTHVAQYFKKSKNLWLYLHYKLNPNNFNITEVFEKHLWSPEMKDVFRSTEDNLFLSSLYTNHSEILLSKYEQGDHYDWHRDYCPLLTANYMVAKEPLKFTGGSFLFGDWDSKDISSTVEFKNNRLVIFPSRVFHKVTPVENFDGNSSEARFTLQYWGQLRHRQEQ